MSNLLASLNSTADALSAYNQVLDVVQNNVANSSTPGYARQTQLLYAMPFDPQLGSMGGVRAGAVVTSRDQYAEQAVRQQSGAVGQSQQLVSTYTALQAQFDVSGDSGIPSALNDLYQSFSAWGQSPTDTVARQTVIERATDVASAVQSLAKGLTQVAQDTRSQVADTVDHVNRMLTELASLNKQLMQEPNPNAGLDAQVNASLEQLSQYVNFTASKQDDGSITVLLDGQTPLLMSERSFPLQAIPASPDFSSPNPSAPPTMKIETSAGKDVTSQVAGGQLGALLNLTNSVLPGYLGDGNKQGDLNTLALGFAKRVNDLLTHGYISDGEVPVAGVPLFTYDTDNATNIAASLSVDSSFTPDQLAAISAGPPPASNGIALALSALAHPQSGDDEIGGVSYTQYFGNMAATIGSDLNDASSELEVQQSMLAQAQSLRQQVSGVSLDTEAAMLIQFQRAYEANSKLITILDQLTQDAINMLRT